MKYYLIKIPDIMHGIISESYKELHNEIYSEEHLVLNKDSAVITDFNRHSNYEIPSDWVAEVDGSDAHIKTENELMEFFGPDWLKYASKTVVLRETWKEARASLIQELKKEGRLI